MFLIIVFLLSTILCSQAQYYPDYPSYSDTYYGYSAPDTAPSDYQLAAANLPLLVIPFLLLLALFLMFPVYVTISSIKRMALSARNTDTFNVDILEKIHRMTEKR